MSSSICVGSVFTRLMFSFLLAALLGVCTVFTHAYLRDLHPFDSVSAVLCMGIAGALCGAVTLSQLRVMGVVPTYMRSPALRVSMTLSVLSIPAWFVAIATGNFRWAVLWPLYMLNPPVAIILAER